jgi:hypothetical protein
VPLNVVEGGLPSPASTAPDETPYPKALSGRKLLGQASDAVSSPIVMADRYGERMYAGLSDFFVKQGQEVLAQLTSAKADNTPPLEWDAVRYDAALSVVLQQYMQPIAHEGAEHVLKKLGPDYPWSDEPMHNYLKAGADRTAHSVNDATRTAVLAVLGSSDADGWQQRVSDLFTVAATSRAASLARTLTTHVSNFGQMEAGKALGARTKRWRVHSNNPRTSHALIDGLSVPLDGVFPNGLRWPGDPAGTADEVAGCTCSLEIGV